MSAAFINANTVNGRGGFFTEVVHLREEAKAHEGHKVTTEQINVSRKAPSVFAGDDRDNREGGISLDFSRFDREIVGVFFLFFFARKTSTVFATMPVNCQI